SAAALASVRPLPAPRHQVRDAGRPRSAAEARRRGNASHRPALTKVLVIGGGIAGYCAALAARRDGADVTVVARAPGATALYAGGMEIVDDIAAVLRLPHHPLARLGMDAVGLATELDAAISTLQLALGKEGLRFQGGWR